MMRTLEADTEWLEKWSIMDYSLLLGVAHQRFCLRLGCYIRAGGGGSFCNGARFVMIKNNTNKYTYSST